MAAVIQAAIQFFLGKKKGFSETGWLFQYPAHSELFFSLCWLFPKDPKAETMEWLTLKVKPVHSLRQNQVSTAIRSGCLNNGISDLSIILHPLGLEV